MATAEEVAQRAVELGVVTTPQVQEVWNVLGSRNVPISDFMQIMVRKEYLTNYQVDRILKGERSGFFFGDYKVLYLVGTGTFARVYRAMHRKKGHVVAVKVLRKRFSEVPEQFEQFIREGERGLTLRHPNVVPVYEVSSHHTTHFLVMEFVEGQSLRDFVKVRKKLAPMEAIRLMIDIVSGLLYAFERGLTHRDLRMSNVLVSSRGQAKLCDFGLANQDEAIDDVTAIDTPATRMIDYAALERATGVRKNDVRSDIYFAGCIFYHMLSGVPPLPETTDRMQRLNKTRFLSVVPIQKAAPSIPHTVMIAVNRAMVFDPMRRYQSPREMLADLRLAAKRLLDREKRGGGSSVTSRSQLGGASRKIQHSVMIVESNAQMQELLRNGLKGQGYRVLLTTNPQRAYELLREAVSAAHCVVFSTQEIGEFALQMFNKMGQDEKTAGVPCVLLLGAGQKAWQEKAVVNDHRSVLCMPISLKQLVNEVARLAPQPESQAGAQS